MLLGSVKGTWLSILDNSTVLRAETGSLLRKEVVLKKGSYKTDYSKDKPVGNFVEETFSYITKAWQYPSAKSNSQITGLTIEAVQQEIALQDGKASTVIFNLKNNSGQAIYRPRLLFDRSGNKDIQLIPANPQASYPQAKAIYSSTSLIPAKGEAQLSATLIFKTKKPVASIKTSIPIVIEVSGGETKKIMLEVNLQTPDVQVQETSYVTKDDTATLNIKLKNFGTATLPKTFFYLKVGCVLDTNGTSSASKKGACDASYRLDLPRQIIEKIDPQQIQILAFGLSNEQLKSLFLEIRPMRVPLYADWQLPLKFEVGLLTQRNMLLALSLLLLVFTVFYLRRYRHPLVLLLSDNSANLFALPLEQLNEAQRRLQQTQRLDKVLSDTEVSKAILQKAIDFYASNNEAKIKLLSARSHAPAWERIDRCSSVTDSTLERQELHSHAEHGNERGAERGSEEKGDLYRLTLSKNFPLNIPKLQVFFPNDLAVEDIFNQLKNIPQAQNDITLIISNNSENQRKLYTKTKDISNQWVAPLGQELSRLLLKQNAEITLAEILAGQLSLQQISPYRIGGGVENESLFFGRREMLSQIINRYLANYLLVGGRQVGKSTLLKALERRYADNTAVACFYISLSNEVLIPRLASLLKLEKTTDPEVLANNLEQLVRESGKHYVFLIDEADRFIQHEQQQSYPILQVLRRLSEEGGCHFFLAGFWQLYQHAVLDYQSPIRNFGELLQVGALEREACFQLATVPMQPMQLQYANSAIIEQLINACGQRANLISKICQHIVANLPVKQRVIEAGDVHEALYSDEIRKELTGWVIGNNPLEQHYDRLVVYATVSGDHFSTGELISLLQHEGVILDIAELERTLLRLEMAFILRREKGRWLYRVPLFVEYMREESPELKLEAELLISNDSLTPVPPS